MAVFHYTENIGQGLGATGIFFRVRSEARINVGHEYDTSLIAKRWLTIIFDSLIFGRLEMSLWFILCLASLFHPFTLRLFYFIFIYRI